MRPALLTSSPTPGILLGLLLALQPLAAGAQDVAALLESQGEVTARVFAPGVVSSPDSSESSPSITADGRTLVFTRYEGYGEQAPHLATRTDDGWEVRRLPFAELVYNLAISPDGETILYRPPRDRDEEAEPVSRVFRVERGADGAWGEAEELPRLRGTNAGYFDIQPDGSVVLYARPGDSGDDPAEPRGVYRMEPADHGGYTPLEFLGRAVSPSGSNTFDPEVFDGGRQMVVTRAGIPAGEVAAWGRRGFYLHRRTAEGWDEGRRLPLPYGWGATVLPDGHLLFVDRGDLRVIDLPPSPP